MQRKVYVVLEIVDEYYIKGGFMKRYKIAIVGASGLVGQTILKVIYERGLFEKCDITLYVSQRSAGKEFLFKGKIFRFVELNEKALDLEFDIVLFSAGSEVSQIWAKKFAQKGSYVIDNTSAFRKEKDIPLVVPEINGSLIQQNTKLIANPNCSTIELAVVVDRLVCLGKIQKLVVSTYQSVSGAGRRALADLKNSTKNVFKMGINNNLISQIGEINENGFSAEENKIMFELSKILGFEIDVSATAVRMPISICHGESVYVKFENEVNLIDVYKQLECDHIKFSENHLFFTNDVSDTNFTYVSRLRQKNKNELEFFILADNLRRGAAYNAVLIAETIIKQYLP